VQEILLKRTKICNRDPTTYATETGVSGKRCIVNLPAVAVGVNVTGVGVHRTLSAGMSRYGKCHQQSYLISYILYQWIDIAMG
jgi:hypothetical protein